MRFGELPRVLLAGRLLPEPSGPGVVQRARLKEQLRVLGVILGGSVCPAAPLALPRPAAPDGGPSFRGPSFC